MPGNPTATACLVLGVVIMYLTMMFVTRFLAAPADAKPENLAKFVGILLGGTGVSFLITELGAGSDEMAWYVIGIGVGFGLYIILYALGRLGRKATGPLFPTLKRLI